MKQIRKMVVAAFGAVVLLGLAGCQLAVPGQDSGDPDQFIGVYITREPVDLSASGGRLYATAFTPDPRFYGPYTFVGLGGAVGGIVCTHIPERYGFALYDSAAQDITITDIRYDDGFASDDPVCTVSGTLHLPVSPDGTDSGQVYFNPVYQSADGRLYLMAGTESMRFMGPVGGFMTWNSTATYAYTFTGRVRTDQTRVSLKLELTVVPEYVVLLQMSADNSVLSRVQYAADAMPETLDTVPGTTYIVVESHRVPVAGQPAVTYSVIYKDEWYLGILYARADGVIVYRDTTVKWLE